MYYLDLYVSCCCRLPGGLQLWGRAQGLHGGLPAAGRAAAAKPPGHRRHAQDHTAGQVTARSDGRAQVRLFILKLSTNLREVSGDGEGLY